MELLVCKDLELPSSPPLLGSGPLEVMMVVALATLHPLPPSELAALVLVASEATTDSNRKIIIDYLGVNPGGRIGAAGLLVEPSLPDGQAANLLHHFVVHPMVDGLSMEQKH